MYRIRQVATWLLLTLFVVLVSTECAEAQVRVRGYVRKDGTYVQPHYRSRPDGNFDNNWSTKGNVNPYTGRVGTKVSPPTSYGQDVRVRGYFRQGGTYVSPHYRSAPDDDPSNNLSNRGNVNPDTKKSGTQSSVAVEPVGTSSPDEPVTSSTSLLSLDEKSRAGEAQKLERLGYSVDWRKHSYLSLSDMVSRIRKADEVKELGHPVDWQDHTYLELVDMAGRIRMAKELRDLGYEMDWQAHAYLDLADMVHRIGMAKELRDLGYEIDWQDHTYLALADIEYRIRVANELRDLGHEVDWKKHSCLQLSSLAHQLRQLSD